MKNLLLAVCMLLMVSAESYAGNQSGTVGSVMVSASNGLVYFDLSGAKAGSPSCATHSYWMIRDENSNAGKQQFAMVLAAKASGKSLNVVGLNTCTRWSDGEDVDWIQILD